MIAAALLQILQLSFGQLSYDPEPPVSTNVWTKYSSWSDEAKALVSEPYAWEAVRVVAKDGNFPIEQIFYSRLDVNNPDSLVRDSSRQVVHLRSGSSYGELRIDSVSNYRWDSDGKMWTLSSRHYWNWLSSTKAKIRFSSAYQDYDNYSIQERSYNAAGRLLSQIDSLMVISTNLGEDSDAVATKDTTLQDITTSTYTYAPGDTIPVTESIRYWDFGSAESVVLDSSWTTIKDGKPVMSYGMNNTVDSLVWKNNLLTDVYQRQDTGSWNTHSAWTYDESGRLTSYTMSTPEHAISQTLWYYTDWVNDPARLNGNRTPNASLQALYEAGGMRLALQIPASSQVRVTLHTADGRQLSELHNGPVSTGTWTSSLIRNSATPRFVRVMINGKTQSMSVPARF
jgi:hypothetical protein